MSRNLCDTTCDFCQGPVNCVGEPHPITEKEAGHYFGEFVGMIVADAACVHCEAPYLAWLDGTKRLSAGKQWGDDYPHAKFENDKLVPSDLSHRSSFNDEPGTSDYPKYRVETIRMRYPREYPYLGKVTEDRGDMVTAEAILSELEFYGAELLSMKTNLG